MLFFLCVLQKKKKKVWGPLTTALTAVLIKKANEATADDFSDHRINFPLNALFIRGDFNARIDF